MDPQEVTQRDDSVVDLSEVCDAIADFNRIHEIEALQSSYEDVLEDLEELCDEKDDELDSDNEIEGEFCLEDEDDDAPEIDLEREAVGTVVRNRQESFEKLEEEYHTILASSGLGIELSLCPPWKGVWEEEFQRQRSGDFEQLSVFFKIEDIQKYLDYFRSFLPFEIDDGDLHCFERVLLDLRNQLTYDYDLKDPNDNRAISLLGSLGQFLELAEELELGFDAGLYDLIHDFKTYYYIGRERFLYEFLEAERKEIIRRKDVKVSCLGVEFNIDEDDYPPSHWHRLDDVDPEDYEDIWYEALEALETVNQNPRSRKLAEALREKLSSVLFSVRSDLEVTDGGRIRSEKEIAAFCDVLDDVYGELRCL